MPNNQEMMENGKRMMQSGMETGKRMIQSGMENGKRMIQSGIAMFKNKMTPPPVKKKICGIF